MQRERATTVNADSVRQLSSSLMSDLDLLTKTPIGTPFEKGDIVGMDNAHWREDRTFLLEPAQQYGGQFLPTFKEFPPSQKVGSFSLDQVLEMLQKAND